MFWHFVNDEVFCIDVKWKIALQGVIKVVLSIMILDIRI